MLKQCTACDRKHHGQGALCDGCRKYQRRMAHADVQRNPATLSQQRTRWTSHGKYAPPFKSNTPEYFNWYRDVQAQARRSDLTWPEFYAQAKEHAHFNPIPTMRKYRRHRALFGGAKSKEYQRWYYRLQCQCRAQPTHEQNWPEFFAAARDKAMQEQGLIERNTYGVQVKPHNIVPLNPAPTYTDAADTRLMFDFTVPPPHHLVTD
jgi:hypothetical protein